MALTKEQLDTELQADPKLADLLAEALKGRDYIVATKTDYEAQLETVRGAVAGEKLKEVYGQVDAVAEELFGIKRTGEEKTTDFLKRLGKERLGKIAEYEKQVGELTEKLKAGADPATVKELEKLRAANQELLRDKDALGKRLFETQVRAQIDQAVAGFKFLTIIPDDVRNAYVDGAISKLLAAAKVDDDGQLSFVDENGETLKGADLKPRSAESLLKERLKSIIDTGKQAKGAGSGADAGHDGGSGDGDPGTPPATVKTKVALTAWLKERGIKEGTADFDKYYQQYGAKLPLR